jgi:hypothetical protein
MKFTYIFKIILLALPALLLIYVFVIRDRIDAISGIGGGGYDLTKMYTLIGTALYLLILDLGLLIQGASGNRFFLLAGLGMLIVTVVMAVRSF